MRKRRILLLIPILLSSAIMLLPFAWMLSASLKTNVEVFEFPIEWIPKNPQWRNYVTIWSKIDFGRFYFNTIKLTVIITLLQLATCSLAAYAFAKIDFPERNALFVAYIATLIVPFQVIMVPQFILFRRLGLVNRHLALILLQAFSPFGVFLMRQFYLSVPNELVEAARIDGLSEFGILSEDHAAAVQASAGQPDHFYICFRLERFLGSLDLPPFRASAHDPAGNSDVHFAIHCRICPDYGCFSLLPHSCSDRFLGLPAVLRRGHYAHRAEGLVYRGRNCEPNLACRRRLVQREDQPVDAIPQTGRRRASLIGILSTSGRRLARSLVISSGTSPAYNRTSPRSSSGW